MIKILLNKLRQVSPFTWLVLAVPFILLSPVWMTGKALYYGTPYLQFVPWRSWAWEMLGQGQLPLWNPLVGMGAPLAANYQSALFYPPNWFLWLLQVLGGVPMHAWGQALLAAGHLALAGLGMSRLASQLGIGKLGQTVSGLAFGLSSYLVSRAGFLSINAAAAWIPWVIMSVEMLRQAALQEWSLRAKRIRSSMIMLGVSLGLQLLAGHAQTTWYTLVLAGVWTVVLSYREAGWKGLGKAGILTAAGGQFAALLAAIQLLPTAEYLAQSQRAAAVEYEFALNYSFWPWRFLSFIAPDFFGNPAQGDYWFNAYFWEDAVYIGLLPLLLGLGQVFRRKHAMIGEEQRSGQNYVSQSTLTWLLAGITAVSLLFALGRYTPVYPFLYRYIPTFDMFQAPTRWSILAVFSLALLAGMGADRWYRPEKRALYWTRLATAGAVAVMIGAGAAWLTLGDVRPTFIRATALAGAWGIGAGVLALFAPKKGQGIPRWWQWAVVGWIAFDLLVAGWGLNPGISLSLYTKVSDLGLKWAQSYAPGRYFIPVGLEKEIKYDRFFQEKGFLPDEDPLNLGQVLLPNAAMLQKIPTVNNYDPLVPGRYERWITYLEGLDQEALKPWLPWMGVSMVGVKNSNAPYGIDFDPVTGWQSFRWATTVRSAMDGGDAFNILTSPARTGQIAFPRPGEVILEGVSNFDEGESVKLEPGIASITTLTHTPNRVVVEVDAPSNGWLVQTEVWYPGWHARMDGNPQSIYRADFLFRAVQVPAGRHTVEWIYSPASFWTGMALTILGLAVLFLLILERWRRQAE